MRKLAFLFLLIGALGFLLNVKYEGKKISDRLMAYLRPSLPESERTEDTFEKVERFQKKMTDAIGGARRDREMEKIRSQITSVLGSDEGLVVREETTGNEELDRALQDERERREKGMEALPKTR